MSRRTAEKTVSGPNSPICGRKALDFDRDAQCDGRQNVPRGRFRLEPGASSAGNPDRCGRQRNQCVPRYRTLGGKALATGFLGGTQGRIVARELAREGITGDFVEIAGETRVCIAIVDPKTGTQTEVNEHGPNVSPEEANALRERFVSLLRQQAFDYVVLSGSLPPGAPDTLYAELTELARAHSVPVVLDASGEALRQGIKARPWLVKPNQVELQALLNRPMETEADTMDAARELQGRGIANVIASRGEKGAILVSNSGTWRAVPPQIEFASAVASGDSFVAGFLWAWQYGEKPHDPESALRLATGAGAANAMVIGAGFCSRESIFDSGGAFGYKSDLTFQGGNRTAYFT